MIMLRLCAVLAGTLFVSCTAFAQLAGTGQPPIDSVGGAAAYLDTKGAAKGLFVDTQSRADVVNFYFDEHVVSEGIDAEWTGAVDTCSPGITSMEYEMETLRRVNFYRAMAGLPGDVTFNGEWNAKCQDAALMMIAEGSLSHTPPPSWACFTDDGQEAAGKSNLAIGASGPRAIDLYMIDSGANNQAVGHRRWILFPPQQTMGTGSVTAINNSFAGANALWVIGGATGQASQPVAWPPEGFTPFDLVPGRWSYSHPGANFSGADVTMIQGGASVDLTVLPIQNGFGDNTIVWEPVLTKGFAGGPDQTFTVMIDNVVAGGESQMILYDVTVIDPNVAGPMEGEGEDEGASMMEGEGMSESEGEGMMEGEGEGMNDTTVGHLDCAGSGNEIAAGALGADASVLLITMLAISSRRRFAI